MLNLIRSKLHKLISFIWYVCKALACLLPVGLSFLNFKVTQTKCAFNVNCIHFFCILKVPGVHSSWYKWKPLLKPFPFLEFLSKCVFSQPFMEWKGPKCNVWATCSTPIWVLSASYNSAFPLDSSRSISPEAGQELHTKSYCKIMVENKIKKTWKCQKRNWRSWISPVNIFLWHQPNC